MIEVKIGDEIFHKSNSTVKWIVERIDGNELFCSTVIKETLEQKKEVFSITSVERCAEPQIIVGKQTRKNYW